MLNTRKTRKTRGKRNVDLEWWAVAGEWVAADRKGWRIYRNRAELNKWRIIARGTVLGRANYRVECGPKGIRSSTDVEALARDRPELLAAFFAIVRQNRSADAEIA